MLRGPRISNAWSAAAYLPCRWHHKSLSLPTGVEDREMQLTAPLMGAWSVHSTQWQLLGPRSSSEGMDGWRLYTIDLSQIRSTALSAHTRLKPDDSGVMVVLTSGDDTEPEDLTLAGHSSTVRCPRLHWPAPQRITKCGALAKVSRRSHMRGKGGHAESTFDRARPHHV